MVSFPQGDGETERGRTWGRSDRNSRLCDRGKLWSFQEKCDCLRIGSQITWIKKLPPAKKGIENVSNIKDGYNPATWMLEVTSLAKEIAYGVDFAGVYKKSELYRRNKTHAE